MPEDMESVTTQLEYPRRHLKRSNLVEDMQRSNAEALIEGMPTSKTEAWREETSRSMLPNIDRPLPVPQPAVPRKQVGMTPSEKSKTDATDVYILREQCRQLCLSLFFREHAPVRSLGFTSSLNGEGKSFLALLTADLLANDSGGPVTLLECNWENPFLHQHFGFPATPGLAEWLHGECSDTAMRRKISRNLTVIPAGDGKHDAVALLQHIRQRGLVNMLGRSSGLLVVDLPSVVTTAYSPLAASLLESLIVVVRAGVTTDSVIAEACERLKDLPVHGLVLNQMTSRIPRWLRRML